MTTPVRAVLADVSLPVIELPREAPEVGAETYRARVGAVEAAMASRGLDALVVYGDREHFAALAYLTGFDPRYEEALMVLVPGRTPRLIVGNEDVAYARITPYPVDIVRQPKFSLVGQPDPEDVALADQLHDAGLADASIRAIGIAGWKTFAGAGTDDWFEVPHYLVEIARGMAERVVSASGIFVDPDGGLRTVNEADQIAVFEFAASHSSSSIARLIHGIRPGMTELEASALMTPVQLPLNYHPTMLSGPRTAYGVASPGGRVLEVGDPVAAGIGHWGSNTARAGFLVDGPEQLAGDVRDYVERLVAPYFDAAAAWYETMRIGLTAGELYETVHSRIGDPFYGVYLNPGHFIHLDEWPSSPVRAGSEVVFRSGNAIQVDIIPGTGTQYHTSQIEDGIVLADEALRVELASRYPAAWARIQQRKANLAGVFGIETHPEVLPLSNTAGWLPPYWLSPGRAMVRG